MQPKTDFSSRMTDNYDCNEPRSQSSSAISDVTSPVMLVGKIRCRARFQALSCYSDSANWPGYEAGL